MNEWFLCFDGGCRYQLTGITCPKNCNQGEVINNLLILRHKWYSWYTGLGIYASVSLLVGLTPTIPRMGDNCVFTLNARSVVASPNFVPSYDSFIYFRRETRLVYRIHRFLTREQRIRASSYQMAAQFTLPKQASTGFSDASHYDKYRPSYPVEAVEKLLKNVGVAGVQNARIIDLACGTGKFTELLAVRPENYEIVGIEPHQEMREQLEKKGLPQIKVLAGDACNMPIEDGWGDALIAAQV